MGEIPERDELIPLVEEQLEVGTREVERGRVVVRKRVEAREELAEAVLHRDELSVERVPLGVPVDAPPPVREEGDVLIVPVLEEQLVVRTRLILKEELPHHPTPARGDLPGAGPLARRTGGGDPGTWPRPGRRHHLTREQPHDDRTHHHRHVRHQGRRRERARRPGRRSGSRAPRSRSAAPRTAARARPTTATEDKGFWAALPTCSCQTRTVTPTPRACGAAATC